MKKSKRYEDSRFSADVIKEATEVLNAIVLKHKLTLSVISYSVEHDDSTWNYDKIEEFLADFRKYKSHAHLELYGSNFGMSLYFTPRNASVSVTAHSRAEIEQVFCVFEAHAVEAKLEPLPVEPSERPIVFIGHGKSQVWRELKDHLQDKHGIRIEAFETGARAGHAIRDILEEMVSRSTFALLVLTGEDEQADGSLRARQNVIHEAGLFQGTLGFARAILLLEEGVEEFSNVQGIQYIRFANKNIREIFGEVVATIHREFPN